MLSCFDVLCFFFRQVSSLSPRVSHIHGVSWVIFLLSYLLSVLTSFIHTLAVFSIGVCSSDIVPVKVPGLQFLSEVSCGDFCFLAPMLSSFSPPLCSRRGSGYLLVQCLHVPALPVVILQRGHTQSSLPRAARAPWATGGQAPGLGRCWPCSGMFLWRDVNHSKDVKDRDWVGARAMRLWRRWDHETMECLYSYSFSTHIIFCLSDFFLLAIGEVWLFLYMSYGSKHNFIYCFFLKCTRLHL